MQIPANDAEADQSAMRDDPPTVSTKMELRRIRAEEQRVDAAKVRSEMAVAVLERDAKTTRLRSLRLAKEAADREALAALPSKPKGRARKVAVR